VWQIHELSLNSGKGALALMSRYTCKGSCVVEQHRYERKVKIKGILHAKSSQGHMSGAINNRIEQVKIKIALGIYAPVLEVRAHNFHRDGERPLRDLKF
jgi:hypothetical protein